ncbi:MAG: hypothetical protein J6W10_08600 [Kiritimatiellae bacterium]|nr:hypothetical protein [Kiritimatiellia bacterium]
MKAATKVVLTLLIALAAVFQSAQASRSYGSRGRSPSREKPTGSDRALSGEFTASSVTRTTSATFKPLRTVPVQKGEFKVDLVVITFPDCETPDPQEVRNSLNSLGGSTTIADYYKDYSQGITWPVLDVYPAVYVAPKPLGYYCRYHVRNNLIGYKSGGDERAKQLREDALKFVMRKGRLSKKGAYTCFVYCKSLKNDPELRERLLRPSYPPKPTPDELARGKIDRLEIYEPKVLWADPLWPNSLPQVEYPADGGTLVHEIGHLLGAPDFYHASEEHDGVEGTPCLNWSYGPTGMAYCRHIYNAFVPVSAYPKIVAPGEYTLSPRSAKFPMTGNDGIAPLGIYVPSTHPNYLFYIEYCKGEKPPVGNSSANGLLVHVINVTMTSPMMGPPDLCYTYRKDDPDLKAAGRGGEAFLMPGDEFSSESNPKAILPNLLPAGIAVKNIRFNDDSTCTFSLEMPKAKVTAADLNFSLLPQTAMVALDSVTPTSFRAELNVRYRGEPLMTEYGFCYGLRKNPTEKTGSLFRLYHRDRYDARIIDLKPGATYYVRSYAKSAKGIRYGENELSITLPPATSQPKGVTLFLPSDRLFANWYYERWYFGERDGFFVSSNPLLAFMAIANYYRVLPGIAPQMKRPGSRQTNQNTGPIDMTRVHCNPSETRPSFRLAEVEKLRTTVEALLKDAGFSQGLFKTDEDLNAKSKTKTSSRYGSSSSRRGVKAPKYGENAAWVEKCAKALKISNPEDVFVSCKSQADLLAQSAKIREWISKSQPVMVVRENDPMRDDLSVIWPLDIAIIDGIGENEGEFHVVYPNGCDRGERSRVSGVMKLDDLLFKTTDAMLMFYRPGEGTVKSR